MDSWKVLNGSKHMKVFTSNPSVQMATNNFSEHCVGVYSHRWGKGLRQTEWEFWGLCSSAHPIGKEMEGPRSMSLALFLAGDCGRLINLSGPPFPHL